jgi:hypothetical protein
MALDLSQALRVGNAVPALCTQINENGKKLPRSVPRGIVALKAWTINPYGDIALVQNGQSTELYCAGACPDNVGILLRRMGKYEPGLRLDV